VIKTVLSVVVGVVFVASGLAHAQENQNLVGDWGGNYKVHTVRSELNIGVDLKITAVEGNVVTGSAKTYAGNCAGEYQMRGKLDGNNLGMLATNTAGRAGDCKFGFRGTIDGNSIKGTVGTSELNLHKK
jgi:hypothetical protein